MKKTSRKLLSLLMVLAIICSMVPAALAAEGDNSRYQICVLYTQGKHYPVSDNRGGTVCEYCGTQLTIGSGYYPGDNSSYYGHNHRYTYVNSVYHTEECFSYQSCAYYTPQYVPHTVNSSGYCTSCGQYVGTAYPGTGTYPGAGTLGYAYMSSATLSVNKGSYASLSATCSADYDIVTWTSSDPSVAAISDSGTASNYVTGYSVGTATITATFYKYISGIAQPVAAATCTVTVSNANTGSFYIAGSGSGSATSGQMATNEYMLLAAYLSSTIGNIVQQNDLNSLVWTSSNPSVAYFGSYSGINYGYSSATGASVYVYGGQAGTAVITASLTLNGVTYTATYEVTVGGNSGLSVNYSLTTGESLTLDSKSFQDFWSQVTTGSGNLSYVVFGTASGSVGQLTYRRSTSASASAVGSTAFYVSPSYNQHGISGVTFTPAKATNSGYRTGTLAVPFTAYGTDSYYGYGYSANTSYRGTLYIMVTNGKVADIQYKASGSAVSLVPADFTSVYRTALNTSSYNSTFYIQLQDVPTIGDLYYNYGKSTYTSGTKLTSSNIGSLRFSSAANATYGIDDISYVPGSSRTTDTVTYVAYSAANGGTPLYVGKLVFTAGAEPKVEYCVPINKTVSFAARDFYGNSDLYYTEYISFGTPSAGTLYKNYANGTGTRVVGGTAFTLTGAGTTSVPSISALTYVPAANYTGVVTIPFTASSLAGSSISGSVKIYVAKTYPDMTGYSWASDYILRLTAEGVLGGNSDGTFAPGRALTYGEALKMILEATGTSATNATTGHWADNYLAKAYQKGLVNSRSLDLNSKITRDQVAELAAKALGISAASRVDTGITKPTDSSNGYVYALYNAGILNGTTTNGVNRYNGSNTINRAEISKIICLVSDYYSNNK